MSVGYYNSAAPKGLHRGVRARIARVQTQWLLAKHGVRFKLGVFADALPQIHFTDLRRPVVHRPDFAGRIELGPEACLLSAGISPFPAGPVRLTVIKWGDAADQCGFISCNSPLVGTSIVSMTSVKVGSRVRFAPNVVIMDTDGHIVRRGAEPAALPASQPVVLEDDVWVGLGAIILKGVVIGEGAVVGAGAVVTKSVPAGAIVAGNPARPVESRPQSGGTTVGSAMAPWSEPEEAGRGVGNGSPV